MICPFLLWPRFSRRRLTQVGAVDLGKGAGIKVCNTSFGFRTKDNVFFEFERVVFWVGVDFAGVKADLGAHGWDGVLGGHSEGLGGAVFGVELCIRELADRREEHVNEEGPLGPHCMCFAQESWTAGESRKGLRGRTEET